MEQELEEEHKESRGPRLGWILMTGILSGDFYQPEQRLEVSCVR